MIVTKMNQTPKQTLIMGLLLLLGTPMIPVIGFQTSMVGRIPRLAYPATPLVQRTFLGTTGSRSTKLQALAMSDASAAAEEESKKNGFIQKLKSIIPPANERQKLVPLALMFFCILFSYTILRDTKDVLMVTAPKSGAEGKSGMLKA
jgi:hypothetical protein